MSSDKSLDPLQEYLNSLLGDSPLNDTQPAVTSRHVDEAELKFAAGSNIAALPSAARPARVPSARPYAEPVRTLNLRMPLPPIAPALVPAIEVEPAIQVAANVETKLRVELKPSDLAEQKPVETPEIITPAVPVMPTQAIVEAESVIDLAAMAPPAAWLANGRPQWAQQPFECLIFKAGGLQLAAPLVELGSIYPLEADGLTTIFGQKHWFMGLLSVKEYNVRAMDTALVVMPERYSAAMREDYRYIVTLFGSDWGLAVDAVVGTVMLDPEHIRWRGERSKRPWLAGTLIDQMCALFDIAQLAWLFHNQDRKRAPG